MNAFTKRGEIAGPAGALAVAVDSMPDLPQRGLAVICHPHPLHGGTMDNKVVQTVARALVQRGWRTVRFNFRGVGTPAARGTRARRGRRRARGDRGASRLGEPLVLAGFSFGGYVAAAPRRASRRRAAAAAGARRAGHVQLHGAARAAEPS
jgi:alpha/beta superfamily hydrolase